MIVRLIRQIRAAPLVFLFSAVIALLRAAHRSIGQWLWPEGTKRHTVIHAAINIQKTISTGWRALKSSGLWGLMSLVSDRLRNGNVGIDSAPDSIHIEPILLTADLDLSQSGDISSFEIESDPVLEETPVGVSVIIPTLNGSHELLKLLPTLLAQKGFQDIELIVVDSGSLDDTVDIAREYGATVITISPKEFTHSGSRNLGANNATQEVLLFITQDALPTSDTWLHSLYTFQRANGLAAVSCMEVPKIDADLFSRVENWHHYHVILDLDGSDRVLSRPQSTDPASLRRSAQLSNVSCLIPKEIFFRYRFRLEYAEDLDLGLRLINDGHRLGLLSSTKVIHSHTRPPNYYLKRGYIDKIVLSQLLNETLEEQFVEFRSLMLDMFFTLNGLKLITTEFFDKAEYPISFVEFRRLVKARFAEASLVPFPKAVCLDVNQFVDQETMSFISPLYSTYFSSDGQPYRSILLSAIEEFHEIAFRYMESTYDAIDKTIADDYQSLTYNYFINMVGRCLAVCYLKNESESHEVLNGINLALRRSI